MPTAFLTASTFEVLPFLGTPGAGTVGHTLLWSESPKGFTLSPISVGPDQFSGVLPVSKGGTGTSNGSITGTGALTFAAGGTNQNINLNPSGTGAVTFPRGLVDTFQVSSAVTGTGITPVCRIAQQAPWGGSPNPNYSLLVEGYSLLGGFRINAEDPLNSLYKPASGNIGFSTSSGDILFSSADGDRRLLTLKGLGNVGIGTESPSARLHVGDTTASTSTTTGAVRIDGGLAVGGAIHGGSSLTLASDASAAQPAIVAGTSNGLKIGTATSQKLGFFDATPVVQPTTGVAEAAYVENSGGVNVNDDSTFDGYTLRQVVKALRNLGILA